MEKFKQKLIQSLKNYQKNESSFLPASFKALIPLLVKPITTPPQSSKTPIIKPSPPKKPLSPTPKKTKAAPPLCINCSHYQPDSKVIKEVGNPQARVAIIGNIPSQEDINNGLPFTGEVGDLLQKMTKAINLNPNEMLFGTVIKCSPSKPLTDIEKPACQTALVEKLADFPLKAILLLGEDTTRTLLQLTANDEWHGVWYKIGGISTLATYHPKELLTDTSLKRAAWNDLKLFMSFMESK